MARFFNTTGPCNPERHYMLPATRRLPGLRAMVERDQYFVLHAPRQVGKTTSMLTFAAELRNEGYAAVWFSLERGQGMEEIARAEPNWLQSLETRARSQLGLEFRSPAVNSGSGMFAAIQALAAAVAPRRLVVLIDEADTATGPALVSLLRQLRDGFVERAPGLFATSVALIGMRDPRDYLTAAKGGVPTNPGSPFNIKIASITLRNFMRDEVAELYGQHTADTGQAFLGEAVDRVMDWTAGQPFLVNALALDCMDNLVPDRAQPVTAAHIDLAKERLILSRTTHLDALAERLKEARVARIVESVLLGDEHVAYNSDDFRYVTDLGLVVSDRGGARAANRMYQEILARELSVERQDNTPLPWWPWRRTNGTLDFPALVGAFRDYWRENADIITEHLPDFPEAVAHIAYMAFLQRVVNGGGRVEREFAAGRGAVDLVVDYAGERFVTEIKRVRPRDSHDTVRAQGLAQLSRYLDTLGMTEGWLLIVDQHPGRTWAERLWTEDTVYEGKTLHLAGV